MKLETKREIVKNALQQSKDKFFTVKFIKRTTGEPRTMNGRLGVKEWKKYDKEGKPILDKNGNPVKDKVKGVGLKFDPFEKGLLPVYDTNKHNYRTIDLDSVYFMQIRGGKIIIDEK